ncbi:toxin-antitoxin system YwqK family antitoxin [Photobacterium nomapromontoriensis]|uniref:toxin-antitoxin system YwqK family antitoxin n=1 Tax=Photobacterium nomapromontoriensis TaxID=2910237 RepID=UPI003D108E4E
MARQVTLTSRFLLLLSVVPLTVNGALLEYKGTPALAYEVGGSVPYSGTDTQYYFYPDKPEVSPHKLSEITYVDGKMQGQATYWLYNGQLSMLHTYDKGVLNGRAVTFYPHMANRKAMETFYVKGKEDGLSTYWDTHGRKQGVMNMKQGWRHGVAQGWSDSGALIYNGEFAHNKRQGEHWWYYNHGQKQQRTQFMDGQYDGIYQVWYEEGQLATEVMYAKGQLHGEARYWYENGQLKHQVNYLAGAKQGQEQFWYEDGTLMHSALYQAGLKQGKQQTWYKNGQPQSVSHFSQDQLHGEELLWTEAGVKTRFEYSNGIVIDAELPR